MADLYDEILGIFNKNPDVLFGISKTDFSRYKVDYKCALVFAVPHAELLRTGNYKEEKFERIISRSRARAISLAEDIADVLRKHSASYYIPPTAQESEETLLARFSFKYAAVSAGLGWIGKNDVLVTEKYGPRVTLFALLIDDDLQMGNTDLNSDLGLNPGPGLNPDPGPDLERKCPEDCILCVKACPYNALTGKAWHPDIKREELIDYQLCNQKRSLYIETHDRKHACGLCMAACPFGL